jgi:hypothetical protein
MAAALFRQFQMVDIGEDIADYFIEQMFNEME